MTWSILARDPATGFIGMAVASRFFAVGAVVPFSSNHGAVMSQALPNPELGVRGLQLLAQGHAPATVRDLLVAQDVGIPQRQLHVMDFAGASAAWTGSDCIDWCGDVAGPGVSVAGNMLAGEAVVVATRDAFLTHTDLPIVERLLAAMRAGEAAGGDKRGKQGAALRIQGPECYPRLDLRADDHADPLGEIERLYDVAKARFIPFSTSMPRRERPAGILDREVIEAIITREAGKPFTDITDIPG